MLDFAFNNAVRLAVAGTAPTSLPARVYEDDPLYESGAAAALRLPTFAGNHDRGRFGWLLREVRPTMGADEQHKRDVLAHALMMFGRGVPTIYSGDEQGFAGLGGDQDARQDMFGSRVASYNGDVLIGTGATTETPRFDPTHLLYRALAAMARVRAADPALRRGTTLLRASDETPGLLAYSRKLGGRPGETLAVFNTSTASVSAQVRVDGTSVRWRSLMGTWLRTRAWLEATASRSPRSATVCTFTPAGQ